MAFAGRLRFVTMLALCGLFLAPALAETQQTPSTDQTDDDDAPTPAPLTVGAMAIASDAALSVEGMAVDVTADRVTYAYKFKNNGSSKLTLAASVSLPDLEVNNEGTTIYLLPSQDAANVVGLAVQANGKPIATTPYMTAIALGIDRLTELKAQNLPLIPFGDAIEKALAGAKPETLEKLEGLGLVTPSDPSEPDTPAVADWSLHVAHGWMQAVDANATTDVLVTFAPIKAVYTIDATSIAGFDALKQQVCLTPQATAAAKALLSAKGATADVVDITLANDGPARWLDNPQASMAVRKPNLDSVVTFCGLDPATQSQAVVKGKMPGSNEAPGLRVLIITRNPAK